MSCRVVIQKKLKTITRYDTVSKKEYGCFPTVIPEPTCGNYSNNTILDGGSPNTTSTCILDGGNPNQTSNIILVGGSP